MSRPIALRALSDAIANIGVGEEFGENQGKYVNQYLASVGLEPGNPYCAAWLYFRYQKAANSLELALPELPRSGYTPTWKNWARKNSLWISVARARKDQSLVRPGDAVCFYSASKKRIFHIGIVKSVHAWGVVTVEGNTGPEAGVNADGDGVYEKRRDWSELGSQGGFVRINW